MGNPGALPLETLIFGFAPSQIVYVAARLGVADALADGPLTSAELAKDVGAHPPSMYRLLRALASLGIVAESEPDLFSLTDAGQPLRENVAGSLRPLALLFCGEEKWLAWGNLLHTVRTGEAAFDVIHGAGAFDVYASDPELSKTFNEAMAASARHVLRGLVDGYDFGQFESIVDVGGGNGTLLAAVLQANPGLRGTVMDSPTGIGEAAKTLADNGVADRAEVIAGNFFDEVPVGGEAYVLKTVLHDWDDERAAMILRNCRKAIPAGGVLLLIEKVVPVTAAPISDILSDINLMVQTGGRERTEAEFRELLGSTGFELRSVSAPLGRTGHRLVEGVPV